MKKLVLCAVLFIFLPDQGYSESKLTGNWTSSDNTLRYDFLEGFAPKRGIVIQYEGGKPKSIDEWKIESDGIKIGWFTKEFTITGDSMTFDGKNLQRLPVEKSEKIIELKKEPQTFIENLVESYWLNPIEEKSYQYKKGFSSTSGIYSIEKKKEQGTLGSWSFANGVIKIDGDVYPNGRISDEYLFLLDSRDKIKFLKRGVKAPILETMELKEKGQEFISKLVSGRWMKPSSFMATVYKEYRPIFGDLSGVVFNFNGADYTGSSKWEYSLKTGSIKSGYTEYPNAQIQGPFLILLKEDGDTETLVRPKKEKVKEFTYSEVKRVKVSESDTGTLQSLLERQWYNSPDTYNFVFGQNGKEGWLHEFKSYPFVISGNTLDIKGLSKIKDVRFVDSKIVLGDNKQSYISDSKIVYLAHQGKEAATKIANLQKQKAQDSAKSKLVLNIKMRGGVSHRVMLPVGEMKNIVSLSIEPGL